MKKLRIVALLCVAVAFVACKSTEVAPEPDSFADSASNQEPQPEVQPTPGTEPGTEDFAAANQSLLERLDEARARAVEADAQSYYPKEFADAEVKGKWVRNEVQNSPDRDFSADIRDSIARYDALAKAAEAQRMRKRADDMDFSSLDRSAYDAGAAALDKFAQDDTGAAQLADATAAYDSYKELLNKGFVALAGKERNAALEAKKQADSVRAGVAQKEAYEKAADRFKRADSDYVTKSIEAAYEGYKAAKETFAGLYESVSVSRAAAQAAIERAKQRAAESARYAASADEIAPLTGIVQGIEDENAVLLEEDDLPNPEDAVIDVDTGATAEAAGSAAAEAIVAEEAANGGVQ